MREREFDYEDIHIDDEIASSEKISVFSVEGEGLYKILNSINHSCNPNCFLANVNETHYLSLISFRKIKKDEELTISYIDNTLPYKQRQELLQRDYSFTCQCERCQKESEEQ